MSKKFLGFAGKVASKVLPQTTAAAACPTDCFKVPSKIGGQYYYQTCCNIGCQTRCY